MSGRTIYEGSISVAEAGYEHTAYRDGDYVEEPIAGLDERITLRNRLEFTLDYPFERPCRRVLITDAGATLRNVVDAIREGFRVMYRGASHEPIPNLENVHVHGDYGHAFHAIGDLVIERIDLDEASGELDVQIGS